jgi:hypothetical protein
MSGPGTYRFEANLETGVGREARSFDLRVDGNELSIQVRVSRGRVEMQVISAAPSGLRLERAPTGMTCPYVIRNATSRRHSVTLLGPAVLARMETRSDEASMWLSADRHAPLGPVTHASLRPGARRCLTVSPRFEDPVAGSRRIATDADFTVIRVRDDFTVLRWFVVATP